MKESKRIGKARVLVAEDDAAIREGVVTALESEGYDVQAVGDGRKALAAWHAMPFDLLLLDIMMPGRNGYDVCREIRRTDQRIPIVMLTAKGEEIDKVLGLELGADDYMVKPFGVRELLARASAVLRRTHRAGAGGGGDRVRDPFPMGPACIDPRHYTLSRGQTVTSLTATEMKLLQFLHSRPDEVLTRDALLNAVWGVDYVGTTRTLDQHMARLRKKMEPDPAHPVTLVTVHGVGYRYCPAPASSVAYPGRENRDSVL